MKKLRDIVTEAISDLRTTYQKMKDLHDHPTTEPHLKTAAKGWLDRHASKSTGNSTFANRDFGKWNHKKSTSTQRSNTDDIKKYHAAAKDYYYEKSHTSSDTSGSAEEDHIVHNYTHMHKHKIELHMDPEQEHVSHWYHIDKAHNAVKGKGFDSFKEHLRKQNLKDHGHYND